MSRRGGCGNSEPGEEGLCCHYQAIFVRLGDDAFVFFFSCEMGICSPAFGSQRLQGRAEGSNPSGVLQDSYVAVRLSSVCQWGDISPFLGIYLYRLVFLGMNPEGCELISPQPSWGQSREDDA